MRFAIIVPVYNSEGFLHDCFSSIEAQTIQDLELIIIDDGSQDSSSKICDAFVSNHLYARVIHQSNSGLLIARRRGLDEARGEYIVFLDSDDMLKPDALEIISRTISNTNADVVAFRFSRELDYSTIDGPAELRVGVYEECDFDLVELAVLHANFNNLCGKAIRKSCVDVNSNYQEYAGLMMGEDLFQLLPVIDKACSLARIDEAIYYYRPNDSSSTCTYRHEYLSDTEMVANRLIEYGFRWRLSNDAIDGVLILYVNLLRLLSRYSYNKESYKSELSMISASLMSLCCGLGRSLKNQRLDNRMLLKAMISDKPNCVRFIVWIEDIGKKLITSSPCFQKHL